MARKIRNSKIDTPSARASLQRRREPYWTSLTKGKALGYRKGKKGGTWIARYRDDVGKHHYGSLGAADDAQDADGARTLSHAQAQDEARKWCSEKARELFDDEAPQGKYTVRDAVEDYIRWFDENSRRTQDVQYTFNIHVLPTLGGIELARLTKRRLDKWHKGLASSPARVRTSKGGEQRYRQNAADPEGQKRQRQATANRVLATLKATLNHAFDDGFVPSNRAWARVKPFKNIDAGKVRYLTESEVKRLLNASDTAFRSLVTGAVLTGARYGELTALRVCDFNAKGGTIHIRHSKTGKAWHVRLTNEGRHFFEQITAGRSDMAPIFQKQNGKQWGKSQQSKPMARACRIASLEGVCFHTTRHTYASWAVMAGVPLFVVATQLGHTSTKMVEKVYGHLADDFVADEIQEKMPAIGLTKDSVVVPMEQNTKQRA